MVGIRAANLWLKAKIVGTILIASPGVAAGQATAGIEITADAVEYPSGFFARYQPNTALDMVAQVPGFQIDDGDSDRGFAASAGNILVNDRRLSAKQDLPSEILARIPASQVERIELIRGQVRDIDMQGQSVVANVILRDVDGAAVQWRTSVRYNVDFGTTLEGGVSISDRWGAIDYNTGLSYRRFTRGDYTNQDVLDGEGNLTEERFDVGDIDGHRGAINLNAATDVGETRFRLNTKINGELREGIRVSDRTPQAPGSTTRFEQFPEDYEGITVELGLDAERSLRPGLLGKAILLYIHDEGNLVASQVSLDNEGVQTRERTSETDTDTAEAIARIEMNWTGWADHSVQANLERAFNSLDNMFVQTEDTGDGPVFIEVPGANSRVEEVRWDFLLKDTWTLGSFELEYGLGAETSTITQTGDAELERDFSFLKPQLVLAYSNNPGERSQVGLRREVAQLDFNDFVSASVFEDDDLALGNPNLAPESTWRLELSHERRFGSDGAVKLIVFHDWISDVEDLLPLTSDFEAPGNIGDGRRWGVEVESTLPLDSIGITGAKLDLNARWQDSTVVDPVTGEDRALSDRSGGGKLLPLGYRIENEYAVTVDFRQDFQAARVAWGWDVRTRAERPAFKVNEYDVSDDGTEFNLFIETTRWLNAKIGLAAENILDLAEDRSRTVFIGERDLSPVDYVELRNRTRSFRLNLTISGSF